MCNNYLSLYAVGVLADIEWNYKLTSKVMLDLTPVLKREEFVKELANLANRISSDFKNRVLKLVGVLKRRLFFLPTFSDISIFRQELSGLAASEKKVNLLVTGLITPKYIGIYRQSTICNFNQWGMP